MVGLEFDLEMVSFSFVDLLHLYLCFYVSFLSIKNEVALYFCCGS